MKLSIISPIHNGEKFINRLLFSITQQNLKDFEFITVLDHCSDNTENILNSYRDNIPIRILKNNSDIKGAGYSRQLGIDIAQGDWLIFVDCDDYFLFNSISSILEVIEVNNLHNVVNTPFIYLKGIMEERNRWSFLHGLVYERKFLNDNNIRFSDELYTNEDVYFNTMVNITLERLGLEKYTERVDVPFYVYYSNELSITREKNYIHYHFTDFIKGKELIIKNMELSSNEVISLIKGLTGNLYWYTCQELAVEKENTNIEIIKEVNSLYQLGKEFGLTKNDLYLTDEELQSSLECVKSTVDVGNFVSFPYKNYLDIMFDNKIKTVEVTK